MIGWNTRTAPEHPEKSTNSSNNNDCPPGLAPCLFTSVVTMDYMVYFNFFGFVLPPLLLMFAIYLCIFLAARRQLQRMDAKVAAGGAGHGEKCRTKLQKELHAATSLAIIVGLFAFCWLPLHSLNCYTLFCHKPPDEWLMYFAIILSHGNSVVNPFIYAYRIREFRHTFRKIVRRHVLGHRESRAIGSSAHSSSARLKSGSQSLSLSGAGDTASRSPRSEVSEVGTIHLVDQQVAS